MVLGCVCVCLAGVCRFGLFVLVVVVVVFCVLCLPLLPPLVAWARQHGSGSGRSSGGQEGSHGGGCGRGARAAGPDGRPRPGPLPHTIVLVTAQMADMTVVLGNGDALLELVTYLDTNTELARSELHWPGTNFPP